MKRVLSIITIITLFALTLITPAFAADFYPGQEIRFSAGSVEWGDTKPENEISTSYYSVAGQDWNSGKELVSSVRIDNEENEVVLTLRPDYLSTKTKKLYGTIKIRDKKQGRFLTLSINCDVGYNQSTIDIEPDGNIPTISVEPNTVYTVTASDDGYPYGTLMFNADIADIMVRVYDKEKYFLEYDLRPSRDVLIANADRDANMEFLNFKARPNFSGLATLNFYGVEPNYYLYEVHNGKLTKLATSWDKETETLTYKTRTLGSYVISDKPLLSSATSGLNNNQNTTNPSTNDPNPPTGATNVVGIASVIALVSGLSACAVCMKKR